MAADCVAKQKQAAAGAAGSVGNGDVGTAARTAAEATPEACAPAVTPTAVREIVQEVRCALL